MFGLIKALIFVVKLTIIIAIGRKYNLIQKQHIMNRKNKTRITGKALIETL